MSKDPRTIRHGGPGASHENAKKPLDADTSPTDDGPRQQRQSSDAEKGGDHVRGAEDEG